MKSGKYETIHPRLPSEMVGELRKIAAAEHRSMNSVIFLAVRDYLATIHGGAEDEPPYTPEEEKALELKQDGKKTPQTGTQLR